MAELILTLDIGTSSVRTMLFDTVGSSIPNTEVQIPHAAHATADGGVELDPATLLTNTARAIDGAITQAALHGTVIAVAVDTLWHSVLGVDSHGEALTPLYTWADTRAAAAAQELRTQLDAEKIHARTGCILHPSYWPAKLLWLRQTRGDLWKRTRHWLSFGEYLYLQLFGRTACSVSMASGTGLLNVHSCSWDEEILDTVGLEPSRLSPLVDMHRDAALDGLSSAWATRWPSLASIPWFPALGDGACSNMGSGCGTPQRIALMVGTSSATRVVMETPDATVVSGLWFYRVDKKRPLLGGALSEGGNVFSWLHASLKLGARTRLEHKIAALEPDAHGLTILPFLAGERAPYWAAEARGTIHGLTLATQPTEILRASLEAIAYRFALVFRRLAPLASPTAEVVASGGALLHSPAWMSIMADVLGRRVVALAEVEASSRGAALLTLEALGLIDDIATIPTGFGAIYDPDPVHHARYQDAIERQEQLYALLVKS